MPNASPYWNIHNGQTALLVGNGPNLYKTPPEWFNYPSFGFNTIHKYTGAWRPTYYVAVDYCLYTDYGEAVKAAYADIPKFIPRPKLDDWQGENFVRFYHRPGEIIQGGHLANAPDALEHGIGFKNVMHAAMQLAWHMGFTTMLLIGVEQKPGWAELQNHFWGRDYNTPETQTDEHWNAGYSQVCRAMTNVRVLNISEDTYVPSDILPCGDWRDWKNA